MNLDYSNKSVPYHSSELKDPENIKKLDKFYRDLDVDCYFATIGNKAYHFKYGSVTIIPWISKDN